MSSMLSDMWNMCFSFFFSFLDLCFMRRYGDGRYASAGMKQRELKECSPPESLIRTCHRSNEYHLNCFVYGSEFGCRFNLRMCLSSSA